MPTELEPYLEQELAELAHLVQQTEILLEQIQHLEESTYLSGLVSGLALHLHGFYTGVERMLLEIAKRVDQVIPTGSDWHRQLLEQVSIDIPGVRGGVISPATRLALDEFRRFRHVVRSHYAYRLEPERVLVLAEKVPEVYQHLLVELQDFRAVSQPSSSLEQQNDPSDAEAEPG